MDNINRLSNHELANRYEAKQRLIGKRLLDFELMDNDRVVLKAVLDKEDTGRLVIPSFITDIKKQSYENKGVLAGCKYSDIYIDNQDGVKLSINSLCANMESVELRLRINNAKDIVDMGEFI